jgi:Ran GTPase-activating protein (RanGAP) involved in mRNA processing and transport
MLTMTERDRRYELETALRERLTARKYLAFMVVQGLLESWPEDEGRKEGLAMAATALTAWPDEERCVETCWESLASFLDTASWPLVRELILDLNRSQDSDEPTPERFEELARYPDLSSLTRLTLQGDLGYEGAYPIDAIGLAALVRSPYLRRLEALCLNHIPADRESVALLGDATAFPALRELSVSADIDRAHLPQELWSPLMTPERFERLVSWECNCLTTKDSERLGEVAASSLRALSVRLISRGGFDVLLQAPQLVGRLERFRVSWGEENALQQLACCPHWHCLRELDLRFNGLDGTAAGVLAQAPFAGQLQTLNLSGNPLGDAGWEQLASGTWSNLRRLNLAETAASDRGLAALAQSPGFPALRELLIERNEFSAMGAQALAQAPWLGQLHTLDVHQDKPGFGDEGIIALAKSGRLTNLRTLDLYNAGLGPRGAEALATSGARFLSLHLSFNAIGAAGARALVRSGALRRVRELYLWFCEIGDDGMAALMQHDGLQRIRTLGLQRNDLTVVGFRSLANAPWAAGLWELSLEYNEAGIQGLRVLAESPYLRQLIRLNVDLYNLDEETAIRLCESALVERLEHVSVKMLPKHNPIAYCQRFRPSVKAALLDVLHRGTGVP